MKKRFLLGAGIAVVSSLLFAGAALAQSPKVVYPRGNSDPRYCTITEWTILPDGSVHGSAEITAPNSFGTIEVGKNGEPIVATFDNEDDFEAYLTARGQEPLPSIKKPNADQRRVLSIGDGHTGISSAIRNPSGTNVNWSTFISDYSWNGALVTYYAKHPYSFSEPTTLYNGWRILSGPNYTAPYIPSANALGTYNTSYTGPGGLYNWLSLRNRAYPGWASNGLQYTLASGYGLSYSTFGGPGWY